jgi:pimeloyl-ACP methyl ester carboxylesterase
MPFDETSYRSWETKLWKAEGLESPKERRVKLPRIGCTARVQIVGEGPPVVFIHGGPNSGSAWAPLVRRLSGLRCLILDRPGTGLSDPLAKTPSAADLGRLGDDIVADVLDAFELPRAHVVGSSFGGFLAIRSAAKHPDRVDRMVQMACPAFAQGMKLPVFMRFMSVALVRRLMDRMEPKVGPSKSILRQIGHGASIDAGRIPVHFFEWYVALQKYTDTMKNDGAMIGNVCSFVSGFSRDLTMTNDLLAKVKAPTLLYWGADDTFGGEDVGRALAKALPNAQLTVRPRAGHLPWLDDPEDCAKRMSAFLSADAKSEVASTADA